MISFIKKYFKNFTYFFKYLRYRIFVIMGLTLSFGLMDGLGLTMFLPLFQIAADKTEKGTNTISKNSNNVVSIFQKLHIEFTLFNMLIIMVLFFVFKGIFYYIKGMYDAKASRFFIIKIRKGIIGKFSNLNYKYFVTSDFGRIQNLMTNEVNNLLFGFREYLNVLQNFVMIVVYVSFAFVLNPQFCLLIIIGGALFNLIFQKIYKVSKDASRRLVVAGNDYQGRIIQFVNNFKYLKATGLVRKYAQKINYNIEEIETINLKIGKINAFTNAIREPILILVVASVILFQVNVLNGKLSTIIISLLFFYRALASVTNFQGSYNNFIGKIGTMENIAAFEDELDANMEVYSSKEFSKFKSNLELKNYSFSYGNTTILNNINLKINKNQTIAFVGESGSGKTTLVNVLTGLLNSSDGYFIDEIPLTKLDVVSFQSRIGYISQESVIFNDSIFNNVTLWGGDSIEVKERFNEAIKKSQLWDLVNGLEMKENTLLGNNGINLSGGQKQRVSIARELYKNIDILILDEATSALDSETEKYIQENIDSLKGKYTIVIIAHRLATIKNVDEVVLMSKGEIIDKDSFENLKIKSPKFKQMVDLQEV
ncbi:ABC transporter ATP-binding protein [Rhizosphaericola mali]|uniref:ABC transporter ATP-binding protein n=1 Tax=Rhizosphaericola mali TaxID=2545455 RepID=A0A5P2G1A2_9BACT|nr:ABC transporter ATP-binding protein [Rhizosphaericola mali]QES89205.1 ABC transporter ATP-binding protein [Rhizosphaericola mali]